LFALSSLCLAIAIPYDGNPATVGNGVMVALRPDSEETVQALHGKALDLGRGRRGTSTARRRLLRAATFATSTATS
jgi:hypothetical protein